MSKNWELDKEAWEGLLSWLDPDPEVAALKYKTIHAGLVKVLIYRKCSAPEELADETINRVLMKLPQIRDTFDGDPASYFYRVARYVLLEHQRIRQRLETLDDRFYKIESPEPTDERPYKCMVRCMNQLTPANREVVRRYFEASSEEREALAKSLGTTKSTLAVRVYRTRKFLKNCFFKCMRKEMP